jgi:hypothetical protein
MAASYTNKALSALLLLSFSAGCAEIPAMAVEKNCDVDYVKILQTVLNDGELRNYGNVYFEKKNMQVIWDGKKSDSVACQADGMSFSVTNSLGLKTEAGRYVGVMKMYYDEDAAFVEIRLEPTGKTGEFFLRNKAGWKITQKSLFETR